MEFTKTWEIFLFEISALRKKGIILSKSLDSNCNNYNEREVLLKTYKIWRTQVIAFLNDSFGHNNKVALGFKSISQKSDFLSETPNTVIEITDIKELSQKLLEELGYIEYNLKVYSVCEVLTNPTQIDLSIREKYSSEEIVDFLLEKLYDLYDDNFYPILPILNGNGIPIKRKREDFEYMALMEKKDLVKGSQRANQACAQLTLNGKLFIEERRKVKKQNYTSIPEDQDLMDSKFDELFEKLNKLGLGQEIIFEELTEIKNLYTVLDKKNWAELVKGKLIDLGLGQIISKDVMKIIYEHIVDLPLQITN